MGSSAVRAFLDRLTLPHQGARTRGNAMPTQYWRSPETIAHLSRLGRPSFAVEFLRRNAEYRRDYAQTQRQITRLHVDARTARSGLARRWGLRFRA